MARQSYLVCYVCVMQTSDARNQGHPDLLPYTASAGQLRISGVVICLNEAERIEDCLQSMWPVVDEIVLLDSGSTDDTAKRAEALGARVIQRAFDTFSAQKNAGISQATQAWILSIDADERLTPTLQSAILAWRNQQNPTSPCALRMNRLNHLGSKAIRHGSWWPDRKIRLFHRDAAVWGPAHPHEELILVDATPIFDLQGELLHLTADSPSTLKRKSDRYARLWAEQRRAHQYIAPFWKPVLSAAFRWLRDYLFKAGFLDGRAGWEIAKIDAAYTFRKYNLTRNRN
jgi:glycosyltransferase involved in cell wall biosynthesis